MVRAGRRFRRALGASLTSLLALVVIEAFTGYELIYFRTGLVEMPSLLILLPALMAMRGNIKGPYILRLISSLHLGRAEARFLSRYNGFWIGTTLSLMIVATFLVYLGTVGISAALGIPTPPPEEFLIIALLTSSLSFSIAAPVMTLATVLLYRGGYQVSTIVPPVSMSLTDALTPVILFTSVELTQPLSKWLKLGVSGAMIVAAAIALYLAQRRERGVRKVLRENLPVAVTDALISGSGGSFLARMPGLVTRTGLVAAVPGLNCLVGGVAGSVASGVSVRLHLSGRVRLGEVMGEVAAFLVSAAASIAVLVALVSQLALATGQVPVSLPAAVAALSAGLVSSLALSLVAVWMSELVFRRGIDPENVVFPTLTALGDFLTPMASVTLLLVFCGVMGY